MNIQRWKQPIGMPSIMEVNPSGKYIRYKDYLSEITALRQQLALKELENNTLRGAVELVRKSFEKWYEREYMATKEAIHRYKTTDVITIARSAYQAGIEHYKASLVPVCVFRGDFKGAVNGKVEMSVIAINGIPETGTKLYAIGE